MCAKYFTCINMFKPHENALIQVLLLSLFESWGIWGTERSYQLAESTSYQVVKQELSPGGPDINDVSLLGTALQASFSVLSVLQFT